NWFWRITVGQRQRLDTDRCVENNPRRLLMDDHTVGLDIASRRELVEHAHRLCADEGVAVLWATHLIDEVHPGDRVIVLHRGRLLANERAEMLPSRLGVDSLDAAFDQLVNEDPECR